MMAFITHCSKKLLPSWLRLFAAVMLCLTSGLACAQVLASDGVDANSTPLLTVTRADNAIFLSANFGFELPAVVEDALLKGIPIYFVALVLDQQKGRIGTAADALGLSPAHATMAPQCWLG